MSHRHLKLNMSQTALGIHPLHPLMLLWRHHLYRVTHAGNLVITQCPWRLREARFTYNFNACSQNNWESGFLLTEKKKKKVQEWSITFRWEDAEIVDMLISRYWQGIQVEIPSSQLEMPLYMTDRWSWLQKWKLKSFSEKFKLWFDRNHTVSKSENTQKHSAVEDRPQGGREREHWEGGGVAFGEWFSGQLKARQHQSQFLW